jgi:hypothetical protein
VTRAIYRAHFADRERERLRAKMEARHGAIEPVPERDEPRLAEVP